MTVLVASGAKQRESSAVPLHPRNSLHFCILQSHFTGRALAATSSSDSGSSSQAGAVAGNRCRLLRDRWRVGPDDAVVSCTFLDPLDIHRASDWLPLSLDLCASRSLIHIFGSSNRIFNAFDYSTAHWSLTAVFVVCVAISAACQTLETMFLERDQ